MEVITVNEVTGWDPDPTGLVSFKEEEIRTQTHTQRDDHVRIQGENHLCMPSREASGGTYPAHTLTLDLQPPRCEEIDLLLKPPHGWALVTESGAH